MTAKKTAAKPPAKPSDLTDEQLAAAIDEAAAPEMVTVVHPDPQVGRERQVPKSKLERWVAQGWLEKTN